MSAVHRIDRPGVRSRPSILAGPALRSLDRVPPARDETRAFRRVHARLEATLELPRRGDLVGTRPEPDPETRKERRSEGSGLDVPRPLDRHPEQVRLELEERIVRRRA